MISKCKVEEYRALTIPTTIKELTELRWDLISEMEAKVASMRETRTISEEDQKRLEEIRSELKMIEDKTNEIEEKHKQDIESAPSNSDKESRTLRDAIYPNEKIEKRAYRDSNLDLGKLIKGMSGIGWKGANKEREYYRTMESGANKVVIPQQLSDRIIDYARTKSAIFGKVPVIQMENNNLIVAVQTKDAVASFVKEGELIPTSDVAFEGVKLEGKTLALFIPISEQLLHSASNLSEQLVYSCAQAIAQALDKAMIYGKGVVPDTSYEIKGISLYDSINNVSCTTKDYDLIIKGAKAIKKANLNPTNVCLSSDLAGELQMLKANDGQYIMPPSSISEYEIEESNNMKDDETLVFDSESLLLGLHKGITIEWGTSGDMFQRIQKGLRIYLRADLGVIRPKGISLVKVSS
jgi:phage capsid family